MSANVRSASRGTATGTIVPVAKPSPAPVAGDQIWAFQSYDGEELAGMTAPAGFAPMGSLATGNVLPTRVWRKIATVGEPSVYNFGQPNGATGAVHLVVVRDASPTIAARLAVLASQAQDSPTPSVTPAAASHLEIRYTAVTTFPGTATFTAPSGYIMRTQAQAADIMASALATRQLTSSAPSGVKTFTRTPNTLVAVAGVTVSIPSADETPETPPPPPFTPGAGTSLYQYVFRRLLSRAYLGHLDLSGVSFEKRESAPGTFAGGISITSPKIGAQIDRIIPRDPAALNRGPGVIACEILRDGDCMGEAWITGAALRKDRRHPPRLELRGTTLEGYLQHVLLREDLDFVGVDQIEIARALLQSMAAVPGADLGLILQSGMSGKLRDRHYKASEGASYGQRLTELGEVIDGFGWTIASITGASGIERHWKWGMPLGDPDAPHVFGQGTYGGDILDWSIEIDALKGGTSWQARGATPTGGDASVEAVPLMSGIYDSTPHFTAGWPRIDRLVDRSSVTEQQTLEDYAAGWAARKSGAVRVWQVTVAVGAQPSFTPNHLGDAARFAMSDEWHVRTGMGAGINTRHRIIGVRLTPVSRETGKDEMALMVESSEVT